MYQRRQWHPTPVLWPGKSHGWRSLVGYSPWGRKESDTTEWLHFHFQWKTTNQTFGKINSGIKNKRFPKKLRANDNPISWIFLTGQPLPSIRTPWPQESTSVIPTCSREHVCLVIQLCPSHCDPRNCSPPGSSVCGISQARVLEWVAVSFSRGPSQLKDQTHVSCLGRRILYHWATKEAKRRFWVSRSGLGRDPASWTSFQVMLMLLVCGPHPRWGWIVNSSGLVDLAMPSSLSEKLLACGSNNCSIPVKAWLLIHFPGNFPVLSMKVP